MKTIIFLSLILLSITSFAQDTSPIVVNLRDNGALQYNGAYVKMKCIVTDYRPVINAGKDFYIAVKIQYYENVSGAYGTYIPTLIQNNATLTAEEKAILLQVYGDKDFNWQTTNKWVDASGNIVPQGTAGAISELQYWQQFKLNQVAGMGTLSTQGAVDAQYLIIQAIVNKMNQRKNW